MTRPRAFTLIELLVVIGVLAVLIAIAIVGIGRVLEGQNRTQTKTVMGNLSGMLVELDKSTSLNRQPERMWTPAGTEHTAAGIDIWRDADPATAGNQGMVAIKSVAAGEVNRVASPAVLNTQIAMILIGTIPANKKMLATLPADGMMKLPDKPGNTVNESLLPPVLMDAWSNPIILVPAAGLRGVTLADNTTVQYVVTSAKTYTEAELPQTPTPIMAPQARPFFASAGPDGSFALGDDNLYSFEP